jgi:lysophospholipase L1-like esterase
MFTKGEIIVLIGASYVREWNLQEIAGARVVNKGVNGEQTFDMLVRFDRDVIALNPWAVIIWGYINDIFRLETKNIKNKMEATRENLKTMVFRAREHRIHPFLATDVPICARKGIKEIAAGFAGRLSGRESYQDYVNENVRAVNQWIREFSRDNNVILLDFEPVLSDDTGARKKEYAVADGSHISPRGYEKLSGYILAHIELFKPSADSQIQR